jgi:hypothetical protein
MHTLKPGKLFAHAISRPVTRYARFVPRISLCMFRASLRASKKRATRDTRYVQLCTLMCTVMCISGRMVYLTQHK